MLRSWWIKRSSKAALNKGYIYQQGKKMKTTSEKNIHDKYAFMGRNKPTIKNNPIHLIWWFKLNALFQALQDTEKVSKEQNFCLYIEDITWWQECNYVFHVQVVRTMSYSFTALTHKILFCFKAYGNSILGIFPK